MGDVTHYPSHTTTPRGTALALTLIGSADGDIDSFRGDAVASVAHPATGKYTITFKDVLPRIESITFGYWDSNHDVSPTYKDATVQGDLTASSKTLALRIRNSADGGANALSDLTATQRMSVTIHFRNSAQGL